jgi:hypothetical protein
VLGLRSARRGRVVPALQLTHAQAALQAPHPRRVGVRARTGIRLVIASKVAVLLQPADAARRDGRHDLFQIEAGGGSVFQRVDVLARGIGYERRVRHDDVPMNVQVEARSEALAERDGRAFGTLEAERLSLLALPALDLLDEDATDRRQRVWLCGEQEPELERSSITMPLLARAPESLGSTVQSEQHVKREVAASRPWPRPGPPASRGTPAESARGRRATLG